MPPESLAQAGPTCIRLEGVSVRLGGASILEKVDLHLHGGKMTALIGPNGAGKTTLLRAILGQVPCESKLTWHDHQGALLSKPPRIGYVPQSLSIDRGIPMSVVDLFAAYTRRGPLWLFIPPSFKRRVHECLAVVEAEHLAERKLGELSGGEWQRVLLALALEHQPNLLLLDEPVSGIDANGRRRFYETVSSLRRRLDLSIAFVSHDFDLVAAHADEVILLHRRILARGSAREVYAGAPFREVFGSVWGDALFGKAAHGAAP